jgi:hypothetical protein
VRSIVCCSPLLLVPCGVESGGRPQQPFFLGILSRTTDLPRARFNPAAVKCADRSELNGIAQQCYKIFKRRLANRSGVKSCAFWRQERCRYFALSCSSSPLSSHLKLCALLHRHCMLSARIPEKSFFDSRQKIRFREMLRPVLLWGEFCLFWSLFFVSERGLKNSRARAIERVKRGERTRSGQGDWAEETERDAIL